MNKFEKKRNKDIFEVLVILKIVYILSAFVTIINTKKIIMNMSISTSMIMIVITISFILITIYFFFIVQYQNKESQDIIKPIDIMEIIILMSIFIMVLMLTGMYQSEYKFISIFIVIIASMQYSKKYSLIISASTAIILLSADMFSGESMENIQILFQKDMVLAGALLCTSYVVSLYVSIEKEHSEGLKELVNMDELTGLYSHRYFQEYLNESIELAEEHKLELSLLFMDIDYFKNYNDTNGHQLGDLLLKEIGDILIDCVGNKGIVARYGGEEFTVVLRDITEIEAVSMGERIRDTIQNRKFIGQEYQPSKSVTISIGVSSYPKRANNKYQLINTADDALYRAKAFNKNRVVVYKDTLEEVYSHIQTDKDTMKALKSFMNMMKVKDKYTYGHTQRVAMYSIWFSEYLNLSQEDKLNIRIAACLHDIGKLDIPEELLNKKGRLSDEEFATLKNHPDFGVMLIKDIKSLENHVDIVRYHHERYDGFGYPCKLKGEQIPYLARVLSIADSFDAMTSHRPYNKRKSHQEAIEELKKCSGAQFDPELVKSFIEMIDIYGDKF